MANPSELCLTVAALVLHAPWSSLGLVGMQCLSVGPGRDSQALACLLVPKLGFVESGWTPALS